MKVSYSALISGEIEIDNDELDGMKNKRMHIASKVYMAAQEDLDANLEWEVKE